MTGADKGDRLQKIGRYIASMTQYPSIRALLVERAASIAEVVARDLAAAGTAADPLPTARSAVDWLLSELRAGDRVRPASLDALRDEARGASAAGRPVASILDPYLSAGWAIWEASVGLPGAAPALPALGGILMRAGDAAAAAIATAYADAEAAQAARTASARREFIDEVLVARPGDPSLARLARRSPAYGLAVGIRVHVVLAAADRDLGDDDPEASRLAAELGPRASIVATDRGRALAVIRGAEVRDASVRAALDSAIGSGAWTAVAVAVDEGLTGIGAAVASAHAALGIAVRLGRRGRLEPPEATLLEQAFLADEALLTTAVDAVLAPVATVPRTGAALVTTLRVFLETAGNRRETARRLGLAPRTVAYRLRRIEGRLGIRLEGASLLRLGAALFARDLVASTPSGTHGARRRPGAPIRPRRGPARR